MNRKILMGIALIIVSIIIIGAMSYSGFDTQIKKDFGLTVGISRSSNIISDSIYPSVNLTNQLMFTQLSEKSTLINPQNMSPAGWSSWQITPQTITIYTSYNISGNISTVVNFIQIVNQLNFSINLTLFENLTGHRLVSFSLQPIGSAVSGFIFAVTNGTNYTIVNSTVNSSKNNTILVGYGQELNGTHIVTLATRYEVDIFLSSLPNSMETNLTDINQILTGGIAQISV